MLWKNTIIGILVMSALISGVAGAEDIKGYSDCNVCPGSIHYGPYEARKIFGQEGWEAIARLTELDEISIQLNDVLRSHPAESPVNLWTVRLHGNSLIFYLQDSSDESYVQIVTDFFRARQGGTMQAWQPEIFVQSGKADVIERDDSTDQAWMKLRKSNIYQWIVEDNPGAAWKHALNKRLLQALKVLSDQ